MHQEEEDHQRYSQSNQQVGQNKSVVISKHHGFDCGSSTENEKNVEEITSKDVAQSHVPVILAYSNN